MVAINPTLRCPCDGSQLEEAFSYDRRPDGETEFGIPADEYRRLYRRCRACRHWFSEHDLNLDALYDQGYVDATYGGPEGLRRRFDKIRALPPDQSDNAGRVANLLAWLSQYAPDIVGKRLLDVGAGLGVFPALMADHGWKATGIELDPRMAEHLQNCAGVKAIGRPVEDLPASLDGQFDLVTFNKVLEHVEDPVALLSSSTRLLSIGGYCYIEMPDVAAECAGPGREEFFIEHHHVFSPQSLSMLVERAGLNLLVLERLREPSSKFTLRCLAALPS